MTEPFLWFVAGVIVTNMVWALVFIVDTRRTLRRMRSRDDD
jgi:hypothetical protein